MTTQELFEEAKARDAKAAELRKQASEQIQAGLKATPLAERLVYAAFDRCPCGAGLAYDPAHEDENSVFKGPLSGYWDCSAIILRTADPKVTHVGKMPFSFYEIKSEGQPSASGATTRPK